VTKIQAQTERTNATVVVRLSFVTLMDVGKQVLKHIYNYNCYGVNQMWILRNSKDMLENVGGLGLTTE
jgi:hypothetical protein